MFKQISLQSSNLSIPALLSSSKKIKKQQASYKSISEQSNKIEVIQQVQPQPICDNIHKKVICIIPPNNSSISQIDDESFHHSPSMSTALGEISQISFQDQQDNSETNQIQKEKRKYKKNPKKIYKNYEGKVYYCNKKDELGCKFHTLNRTSYYNHIKHAHQSEVEYKCDECPYKSMNKRNLKQHVAYCHVNTVLECHLCGKQNLNKYSLKKHLKEVHCEKQFKCDLCLPGSEKFFKSKSSLNKHIANVHSNQDLKCDQCQYHTKCQQYLKEHIKNKHSNKNLQEQKQLVVQNQNQQQQQQLKFMIPDVNQQSKINMMLCLNQQQQQNLISQNLLFVNQII